VIAAIDELDEASGHRVQYDRQRNDLLNDIYDADNVLDVSGRTRMYAESVYSDLNYSIDALRRLVDSLAGLPGRKAVLYLSDGIEMRAGEDLFYALEDKFEDRLGILQAQSFDVSRRFQALTREASTSRVTFYTLDAAGLRTHSNADADNYQPERGTLVESAHVANLQAPLHFMAAETGGQAILNTNNFLPMLERVGDDFGSYYSLGYTIAQSGSGRYRKIEVKLKGEDRKGLRVRHREGYRDKSIGIRMSEQTLAALNYGYAKNALGVELEFGRGTRKGEDAFLVPLVIKIPMGNLAFVPREDLQRASVRLYITARNQDGDVSPVEEVSVPIEIPRSKFDRARGQAYHLQHSLMMAPGGQIVAVGVRDEIGAVTAVVLGGVRVGA
jgi:VWFA-related protein